MKKKVIFVIIVILLFIIGIIGYMVVSDLRQEDKLMEEVSEINELANAEDIDIDEINERLDRTVTSGDYAKVEVSFKRYLKNTLDNLLEILDIINDERIVTLLSVDNYLSDGKDFISSKKYISSVRNRLEECKKKYTEDMTKDKAMSYISDKGLDSYYTDLYEKKLVDDVIISDKTVENSVDELISILDISEDVLNLLSDNSNSWVIDGENIVFSDNNIRSRYEELINQIG